MDDGGLFIAYVNMMLKYHVRTFITSKLEAVEFPVGLCYYLFGTTRMVGG